MGNCRSAPKSSKPASPKRQDIPFPSSNKTHVNNVINGISSCSTTAALIKAILPIAFPIVRHVASIQMAKEKMILRNEELLKEEDVDENNLPLGPIDFALDNINVVDCETLCRDQESMPEFAWPEQERVQKLKDKKNKTNQDEEAGKLSGNKQEDKDMDEDDLLVLDIVGLVIRVNLGPNVEFTVPVEGPLGLKVNLEIGTGGTVDKAWVQVGIPKLRIWYVNTTRMAYVAFLDRPSLIPQLHVNADRGKGDFFEIEFASGGGGLDDVIESILCGFGPSSVTLPDDDDNKKKKSKKEKPNWVADALGRRISQLASRFGGVGGNRPLEVDLKETIQSSIDSALGKPRPVEAIKADMTVLEAELAAAEEAAKNDKERSASSSPAEEKKDETGMEEEEFDKNRSALASPLLCCGLGA